MVATTFSCDTPNLVSQMVRTYGVSGNWLWWSFLLTGMVTVFVYARLWRRSGVLTDLEFYELRYSGPLAAFLRGFRAIYLGVFFNVMIMASVTLAAIKMGAIILGLSPLTMVLVSSVVVVAYTMMGGLRGVIITDFLQFGVAMAGAVVAAVVALRHPMVGGLGHLFEQVGDKLSLLPDWHNPELLVSLLVIPLTVQWWSVWYPGSEPGGGGYVAQRMLAAKSEGHALGATFFFNVAHYALRPWPWIIVALASLVVYPQIHDLQRAFPNLPATMVGHDMAYPAMLTFLPAGLLGIVVASLVAAFMSTLSTHLNWGASYLVNDAYRRFWRPQADERELVRAGRLFTLVLMVLAGLVALVLQTALQAFQILLQVGAGTGLLFLLRWFWWRINPWSEISAMVISFLAALYFRFVHGPLLGLAALPAWQELLWGVGVTTLGWVLVTLLTPPAPEETLRAFVERVRVGGPGWKPFVPQDHSWEVPAQLKWALMGVVLVYALLGCIGMVLYGKWPWALASFLVASLSATLLVRGLRKARVLGG